MSYADIALREAVAQKRDGDATASRLLYDAVMAYGLTDTQLRTCAQRLRDRADDLDRVVAHGWQAGTLPTAALGEDIAVALARRDAAYSTIVRILGTDRAAAVLADARADTQPCARCAAPRANHEPGAPDQADHAFRPRGTTTP